MLLKLFLLACLFGLSFSLNAQNEQNYIREGNDFFKKGMPDDAVALYDKVTNEPHLYTALLNKGTVLYRQKKYEEAIKAYRQVSASGKAPVLLRSGAHYNTGVVYSDQEKIPESIEEYKKALRLNAKDNNARDNLQKALTELKKSSGGGGGASEQKPRPSKSSLSNKQAQKELSKLEEKEKNTQQKMSSQKNQYGRTNGKDW